MINDGPPFHAKCETSVQGVRWQHRKAVLERRASLRVKMVSFRIHHSSFIPLNAYRGRFAPSPTGPLHFGSLVAAVGSYLEAQVHDGEWLVRIEDLHRPRVPRGGAGDKLRTLQALRIQWHRTVVHQSTRNHPY